MKVDRILEIIIYLVNHDNVPASYLAERFQVSVRTNKTKEYMIF